MSGYLGRATFLSRPDEYYKVFSTDLRSLLKKKKKIRKITVEFYNGTVFIRI